MSDDKQLIHETIANADSITVLTGAGVSTDSGIPDFMTLDDTWEYEQSREELTSISYFHKNPRHFWQVHRELFEGKATVEPNSFHEFIVSLESEHDVTVITQNVDGLHQAAGSSQVIEVHGSMKRLVDVSGESKKIYDPADYADVELPSTEIGKPLKPDVVLFGEKPQRYKDAEIAVEMSNLLIVAGASLRVSPVNLLPFIAQQNMIPTVWLGRTAPPPSYDFTYVYRGELGEFVK